MQLTANVFVTGGSGTLASAILYRATAENWPCTFTLFSRDPLKQQQMKRKYPQYRYVLGDIQNYDALYMAMVGHDTVLHLAALKHIPECEANPLDCIGINVVGSQNVALAAVQAGVKQVLGISTDKSAYVVNTYGATKRLLESIFKGFNGRYDTTFHLCRYGNVIGSNGSVLPLWQRQMAEGRKPTITHPDMTRFWLTEQQAVDIVLLSLRNPPGTITVPLAPALDMEHFAQYLLGDEVELDTIGLRPGEKMHECLVTQEEVPNCIIKDSYALLYPESVEWKGSLPRGLLERGYHSNDPIHWLTADELRCMAGAE